jgi:short-subunit dehydrogenase
MKIEGSTILVTGAAGGIGSCAARRLAAAGATLLLTDFRPEPLEILARDLEANGMPAWTVACDLSREADRRVLARAASKLSVNVLINVAGINPFGLFSSQTDAEIEKALAINAVAPILLCRSLVPILERSEDAHIVNVGSVFGSLGYPGFAVYSASKFAIRGFTEALRRELADTSIRLHYVAPRATRTALSTDRVRAMNEELKVAMDYPETVAAAIEKALRRSRRDVFLGRPERFFSLVNAVFPGLVDRALIRQLPVIKRHASGGAIATGSPGNHSADMKTVGAQR